MRATGRARLVCDTMPGTTIYWAMSIRVHQMFRLARCSQLCRGKAKLSQPIADNADVRQVGFC